MNTQKSTYFQELERSILKTCSCFRPSNSLLPTHSDYVRAAAIKVLCHAEIEAYFESVSAEIITTALSAFTGKKLGSLSHINAVRIISSLVFFYSSAHNAPMPTEITDDIAKQFIGKHQKSIKDNNGIKESNLLNLFLPIGLDISVFDQVGIATLNAFGKSRGALAHNRLILSTQQVLVPSDVKNDIRNLIPIIQNMDSIIFSIKP